VQRVKAQRSRDDSADVYAAERAAERTGQQAATATCGREFH